MQQNVTLVTSVVRTDWHKHTTAVALAIAWEDIHVDGVQAVGAVIADGAVPQWSDSTLTNDALETGVLHLPTHSGSVWHRRKTNAMCGGSITG